MSIARIIRWGWVNWAGLKNHPELHAFVKALIALRKKASGPVAKRRDDRG